MNISPIKTKRDHERALLRIERLMDAKPGTKAGDELDILTTLVEAYEASIMPSVHQTPLKRFDFGWNN
jgi:HTH-type transcriptional regulator/antitoxin HigA